MDRNGVRTLAAAAVAGALLAGCGAGGGAGTGASATGAAGSTPAATTTAAKAHDCALGVRITRTGGSTWGSVTATVAGKTQVISAGSGTVKVPCGQTVSLAQKPTSSKLWPFGGWRISGDHGRYAGKNLKSSTIQVKVAAPTQVQAHYRLAGGGAAVGAKAGTGTTAAAGTGAKASGKAW